MKSTSSNSGKGGKGKSKDGTSPVLVGQKTMVVNMSDTPEFCAATGKRLPFRGMIVTDKSGRKFISHEAAASVA